MTLPITDPLTYVTGALVRRSRAGVAALADNVHGDRVTLMSAVSLVLPVVLIGGWLAGDAVQPADYSPVRQTISVAAGRGATDRWILTGAFAVMAVTYFVLALAAPVRRRARIGLLLSSVCAIGLAAAPEPAHGESTAHLAWTGVGAVSLALWPLLAMVGPGTTRTAATTGAWALRPRIAYPVAALFVLQLVWVLVQAWWGDRLGVAERAETSLQVCWPAVVLGSLWLAGRSRAESGGWSRVATRDGARDGTPLRP